MDEILRNLRAGARVLDLGSLTGSFPAHCCPDALVVRLDLEAPAPGSVDNFVQADAARRIGLRRVDVSGSQIALRNQEIKSEQSALALVGERRQLFAYQRLGVLLLPGVVKLPYQQLLVAASQVLVVSA